MIILYGVIYIINLLTKKEEYILNRFNFFAGVMCISFGLFLVLKNELLIELIPFCGAIILLVDAIYQVRNGFVLKKNDYKFWYFNLIVALIFIVFSVIIMINLLKGNKVSVALIGGLLLFDAIFDIYSTIMINRTVKKIVDPSRILEGETTE